MANTKSFWTLSHGDGTFPSLDAVKAAFASSEPSPRGSSVWATEHRIDSSGCAETIRTVTLKAW